MTKQTPMQQFESKCGRALVFVEHEMSLGAFHDFLLELKAEMVKRMMEVQQQEKPVQQKVEDVEPKPES